ncbi:uncharacterized protein [Miscanthus floridulus]|uniref:uncharacterized protein n=1 Tax=Miscanthus floridulus TaxID=154761 RepID=UPI003457F09E
MAGGNNSGSGGGSGPTPDSLCDSEALHWSWIQQEQHHGGMVSPASPKLQDFLGARSLVLAESLGDGHRHGHDHLHPLQYAAVPDSGSGGHAQPQIAPGAGGGHPHPHPQPLDLSLSLGTGSPVYESMMRRGHGHGSDEQKQYRGVTRLKWTGKYLAQLKDKQGNQIFYTLACDPSYLAGNAKLFLLISSVLFLDYSDICQATR